MIIYTIYKATNNITGNNYIGEDKHWPKRIVDHKSCSFNKKSNAYNYIFHKAIRKYGWENFKWEILYQSLDGEHTLNIMEPHFIEEYNSFMPNGYNMTLGGDAPFRGKKHSKKTKLLMKLKHLGILHTEATKQKISKSKKGKHLSIQHRENTAKAFSKNWLIFPPNKQPVKISNLKKFCRENNLNQGYMCLIANGKKISYKGWKCKGPY